MKSLVSGLLTSKMPRGCSLPSNVSPVSAVLVHPLRHHASVHNFAVFSVLEVQDMRHSALASRSLAVWPSPPSTQALSYSHTESPVIQQKWDRWTKTNHWCKHFQFPRCHVDVDKLCAWKSLSDHQRQNVRLLRTHLLHAHFLQHWHCAYTTHILMRVTHMHGSRVSAVRMSSSLCHLTFSFLMSIFFCYFCSLTFTSRPLPITTSLTLTSGTSCRFSRPKSAGQAPSARGRAVWLHGQVRLQHRLWA